MPDFLIAAASIGAIGVWLVVALVDAGFPPALKKWLKEDGNAVRLATWLIAVVGVALTLLCPEDTLIGSLRSEAISTAFAVIVINELGIYRADLQEKQRIIEQMGSPVNDAALEAVRLARKHGWLIDGSLKDANLVNANLAGADLGGANLERAFMYKANLKGARLLSARLAGAILYEASLEGTELVRTDLSNADLGNATYDSETVWPERPEGFDQKYEVVQIEEGNKYKIVDASRSRRKD